MSRPIRVLIVDDHAIFRETLAQALSKEPDLLVVAHHRGVQESIRTLLSEPIDVVLLDDDLGAERGSTLINWAAENHFGGQFLVVTAGLVVADALWLIRQRVAGIFLKENPLGELLQAIRAVAQGGKWLDQPFLKLAMASIADGVPVDEHPRPVLTHRERATLLYLVEGCSNKQIGERLKVTEAAVKGTIQRLFDKIGVRNRGQLISIAIQKYRNYL